MLNLPSQPMRIFLFTTLIGILGLPAEAQKLYPLQETLDSLIFQITITEGIPALNYQSGNTTFFGAKKDFPALQSLSIQDGDLVLEYHPRHSGDALSYRLDLQIQLPDGSLYTAQAHEMKDEAVSQDLRKVTWMDAMEYFPDFTQSYRLNVRRSLMGAVNCEVGRPSFSLKKRLPFYAAAGVGIVFIGLGQVYNAQSDDYYASYQQRWKDGLPEPGATENPLRIAQKKSKDAIVCSWVGIGILGLDAAFYAWKAGKIKKKRKIFDKFCSDSSSFRFEPTFMQGAGAGIALRGTW